MFSTNVFIWSSWGTPLWLKAFCKKKIKRWKLLEVSSDIYNGEDRTGQPKSNIFSHKILAEYHREARLPNRRVRGIFLNFHAYFPFLFQLAIDNGLGRVEYFCADYIPPNLLKLFDSGLMRVLFRVFLQDPGWIRLCFIIEMHNVYPIDGYGVFS